MGHLRFHSPEFVHLVTNRTEHAMFLLLPKEKLNKLVLFWLTKAKEKYGSDILIFGFSFLSNHFHILLQDPGGQLAEFMCYFQGKLATAVNTMLKRKGKFWAEEYDDVIVDGEEAFWDKYAYVVANPVKSGLVDSIEEWTGVGSLPYLMNKKSVVGVGLNLTTYNAAKRLKTGPKPKKKDHEETYTFELAAPPMLEGLTFAQQTDFIQELVHNACVEYRRARDDKPALGMEKVLAQYHLDRPKKPANRPKVKFVGSVKKRLDKLVLDYKAFVNNYKSCYKQLTWHFRPPDDVLPVRHNSRTPRIHWPYGSYPPTQHRPIVVVPTFIGEWMLDGDTLPIVDVPLVSTA